LVSLQLFGRPFSSYMWKVLIALWADETPFEFRMLGPDHPENGDELRRRWSFSWGAAIMAQVPEVKARICWKRVSGMACLNG
jgi:hypothetical protein